MLLDREEFAEFWNDILPGKGLGEPGSALWVPEQSINNTEMNWFVEVQPTEFDYDVFWNWCEENLRGRVLCFSRSAQSEWWGFEYAEDIPFWVLRWSRG